jgi:phosphoglycolate phosphatase
MRNLWLFDFDGTLVDSETAIKKCYLAITQKIAPSRIHAAQNILIGPTLDESSREILGNEFLHLLSDFKEGFQSEYDSNTVYETLTYPGTDLVLQSLRDRGDKMAVATNKRSKPTSALIKHYQWDEYFEFVACIDQFTDAQNKSEMVALMLEKHAQFKNSYFVGDTLSDGLAAKDNSLRFVKVNYGYGNAQDWNQIPLHKSVDEVVELLLINE